MSNIRYYNQTAPFWDWVASMETNAGSHPFFNAYASQRGTPFQGANEGHQQPSSAPPPPTQGDVPEPPSDPAAPPSPPPAGSHSHHRHEGGEHRREEGGHGCGRHGRGFRRGGGCGPRGRGGFPFGPFGGPFGPRGSGPFGQGAEGGGPFDFGNLAHFLGQQLGLNPEDDEKKDTDAGAGAKDFKPSCDVFDTEDAYVIHVSLPGAKKEDVGVNYDADKSELSIAGVIYRPGNEDFLKTLALDEREIGVFDKKIRLGSRARPAQVEVDDISAKMEDGILIVRVPKLDSEYVDIKKVDIE